jgi:flagellar biosynthesis/type III secretory pathway chaperone
MTTPTPLQNIQTLQSQLENIVKQKKELEEKLEAYDNKELSLQNVEKIEKLEDELDFLNNYHNTLENQLVVIMNEHNVIIPPTRLLQ